MDYSRTILFLYQKYYISNVKNIYRIFAVNKIGFLRRIAEFIPLRG